MASEKHVENAETSVSDEFVSGFKDVTDYSQHTLKAVLKATKSSNELPASGDDFDYYSSYQAFQDVMDVEGKRILHVIQSILKHQNVRGNLSQSSDAMDVEDKFDILIDANDQILERAGTSLDEASGVRKENTLVVATGTPKTGTSASWNRKTPTSQNSDVSNYRLLTARNILRPQLKFKDKIDNSNRPFIPQIAFKPNAIQSLEDSLRLPEGIDIDMLNDPEFQYPHPYRYELDHLQPAPGFLQPSEPKEALPLERTPLSIINTVSDLAELCDTLKGENEIAIDLEHHSYRTFLGITCLMQVSTRTKDYIIDTLELRNDLDMLNEVFTDPNIMKVFHGADSDIEWLQRDFGLYIVNMFDTGQASRVLSLARFSLAYLLETYCQIQADKQYQLADWRIRPLPKELVKYAREDTHYLLYVYDRMRNELIDKGNEQRNLLLSVVQRSTQLCAKVYKKPVFNDVIHLDLYRKSKKLFNSQQLLALKNLYAWRNKTARENDESLGCVLPNHMLLQIAEVLPREKQGVFACCNPIPPMVRQCLNEIHGIIEDAREAPLQTVQSPRLSRLRQPTVQQHPKYDPDSVLNCSHDLSHIGEFKNKMEKPDEKLVADSSSMFGTGKCPNIITKQMPLLTAFANKPLNSGRTSAQRKAAKIKSAFTSPFGKYIPENTTFKIPSATLPNTLPGASEASKGSSSSDVGRIQLTEVDWTLKKNTVKRDRPVIVTENFNQSALPPSQVTTDEPLTKKQKIIQQPTPGPDEIEIPLREQLKSQKKNKNKLDENVADKKVKKKKKKPVSTAGKSSDGEFTPYDYSRADMTVFDKQGGKRKKMGFDPAAEMLKMKTPKVSKSNYQSAKNSKSYTYSRKEKVKSNRGGRYWSKSNNRQQK